MTDLPIYETEIISVRLRLEKLSAIDFEDELHLDRDAERHARDAPDDTSRELFGSKYLLQ
jgi:hypothetical protein